MIENNSSGKLVSWDMFAKSSQAPKVMRQMRQDVGKDFGDGGPDWRRVLACLLTQRHSSPSPTTARPSVLFLSGSLCFPCPFASPCLVKLNGIAQEGRPDARIVRCAFKVLLEHWNIPSSPHYMAAGLMRRDQLTKRVISVRPNDRASSLSSGSPQVSIYLDDLAVPFTDQGRLPQMWGK